MTDIALTVANLNNAKTDVDDLAAIVNGVVSVTTRYGGTKQSVAQALANLTRSAPVTYAGSLSMTTGLEVIDRSGVLYAPKIASLPFTTSGTWSADDENKFYTIQMTDSDIEAAYARQTAGKAYQYSSSAASNSHAGISAGYVIRGNMFDNNNIPGSGGAFAFTGVTDSSSPSKSGNWPDVDGFFYDADGKQFEPMQDVFPEMYGALGDGSTDDTTAIQYANTYCNTAGKALRFRGNTYKYLPSARIDIAIPWIGEHRSATVIDCFTYTGEFFRVNSYGSIGRMTIKTNGRTQAGTGLNVAHSTIAAGNFAQFSALYDLIVDGFEYNINIDNAYMVYMRHIQSRYGAEGEYCVPTNTAGDDGYVTTVLHEHCFYNNNERNIYYAPPVNSSAVTFVGGAWEYAAGSNEQAHFENVRTLGFQNVYIEGSNTIPAMELKNCLVHVDGMQLQDCGALTLSSDTNFFSGKRIYSSGSAAVFTCTAGANNAYVALENCEFPSTGNTLGSDETHLVNTSINGRFHGDDHATTRTTSLSDGVATTVYEFVVPTNGGVAAAFGYEISVTASGVNRQVESGRVTVVASRPANGTPIVAIAEDHSVQALGSGTLTSSFTVSAAADGTVTVQCDANSSLSSPIISFLKGRIDLFGAIADA